MKAWEKWALRVTILLVFLTGVIYFWMKYFIEASDPFSVVNHPWQPFMLDLHILVAPALVLLFGLVLRSHTFKKLKSKSPANRRSGWTGLISFSLMVVSGYLLQTLADPFLLRVVLVIHLVTGTVFALGYLVHEIIGSRLRRSAGGPRNEDRLAA